MIKKIILITLIITLLTATASAVEITNLKTPEPYNNFNNDGCATYTTNNNRYFFIEKVNVDDSLKEEYFTSNNGLSVLLTDNNTYYFNDTVFELYGIQEIVNIDGVDYMVSINQKSKLSLSEENEFLNDILEFNKLNDLTPVEV